MQENLVCLIPKNSAQNITSNLAIYFWNIADYVGILVILQAIFNRILIGIRGFSCSAVSSKFGVLRTVNGAAPCRPLLHYTGYTEIESNTGLVSIVIELHTTRELGQFLPLY